MHLTYPYTEQIRIKLSSWPIVGNLAFFFFPHSVFLVFFSFHPLSLAIYILWLYCRCATCRISIFFHMVASKKAHQFDHLSLVSNRWCVCVCVLLSLKEIQRGILLSNWLTSMPRLDDEHQTMWLAFGSTKTEIDFFLCPSFLFYFVRSICFFLHLFCSDTVFFPQFFSFIGWFSMHRSNR